MIATNIHHVKRVEVEPIKRLDKCGSYYQVIKIYAEHKSGDRTIFKATHEITMFSKDKDALKIRKVKK